MGDKARMGESVAEGVKPKTVSAFKVGSVAERVVAKVLFMTEPVVTPLERVASGVWGRQCIQSWARLLG